MSRTLRLRTATRLFLVHAALSAVPVVALGLVLDQTYRSQARDHGLAQGRAQAAVVEEMAVAPALSGEDLDRGLSAAEREQLAEATDLAVYQGSVLRMRLRDFDGDVVFSDDGRDDGVVPATASGFRAALLGATTAELVDTAAGPAVRVLRPIVPGASGRSVGVLELTLPYEAIAEAVAEQVRAAWLRLLIGLVLLYAVLAALSWSTSRSLRRHVAQREHEALHDALTGLPNRSFFAERAQRSVDAATEQDPVAVVLVDLDRFKHVNDTLGHHAGDALLQAVAVRLQRALRTDDVVARLGGDEFGLVLPHVHDAATAVALVEQVHADLVQDLVVEGTTITPGGSMGVALAPQHGSDVDALLRRADAAMYRGKRGSRSVLLATDEVTPDDDLRALALHGELRRALERDELVLVYQPELDLTTGQVVGLEALVRWDHPERGLLGPVGFLPVLEGSDLVGPFTDWVLRRAVRDRRAWTACGQAWSVSVNVSARNLETPGFAEGVADLLAREAVPPGGVVVEITETALAADAGAVAASVQRLAEAGVPVSVDDFGTGWSSLAQLRALPVREVKVDRSFVRDLATSSQDRALVEAVVALAHGLSCRVVAEGVETPEVAAWLAEAGCDRAQGFLWSRPVPWPELVPASSVSAPRRPCLPAPAPSGAAP